MATILPHPLGPRTVSCQALIYDRTPSVLSLNLRAFNGSSQGGSACSSPGQGTSLFIRDPTLFLFKEYCIRQIT